MYKIEKKPFGYQLEFSGIISSEEIEQWLDSSVELLPEGPAVFSVFVDMRKMEVLPVDSQQAMQQGQTYFKSMGMQRSVVVFSSAITSMQFQLIAKKTGIYAEERYIDASKDPDWEKHALDWILSGIEPYESIENESVSVTNR